MLPITLLKGQSDMVGGVPTTASRLVVYVPVREEKPKPVSLLFSVDHIKRVVAELVVFAARI